ncbi:MAG: hypothetical protein WBQ66_10565, partial [Blastocatellia bacterium]
VVSSYRPVSSKTKAGVMTGESYVWNLVEGAFVATYVDRSDYSNSGDFASEFFGNVKGQIADEAKARGGTITGDRPLSLGDAVGVEFIVDSAAGTTITRSYLVAGRLYQIAVKIPATKLDDKPAVLRVLDSFRILAAADVAKALQKRVDAATPKPLPQSPILRRIASDADEDGLRGRVKEVVEDVEYVSSESPVHGRKPTSVSHYDEQGNLTRQLSYDYRGNPYDIEVYGYIDGKRVSKSNSIRYEYNPPPMMGAAPAPGPQPKRDARYDYEYAYRYDSTRRLIEMTMYMNDGSRGMRYVYEYRGNEKEKRAYTSEDVLNQRYVSVLDKNGNEIEWTSFDTGDGSIKYRYVYAYDFDTAGNWVKKTRQKVVVRDGKSTLEPSSVTYRTIAYYTR